MEYNIAPNTIIGKVIIDKMIHPYENRNHYENWDRAGSFFEDYHTHDWMIVGFKWFGLPGIVELKNYIQNYFDTVMEPTCMYGFNPDTKGRMIQPIIFYDEIGISPIIFNPPMNMDKINEWRDKINGNPNQSFSN